MRRILVILWMLCFGLLSAQTYHIGDVYTAPDGSQGIVYYLHPDGSGGWVVALNDASVGCPWGDATDVPGLVNVTSYYSQYTLADTAGYSNTQTLRNYQNNNTTYAAGKVDFDNGWVLPSVSQLLMLYGQLPFISSALTGAGGTEMVDEAYWTSTEKDASSAYIVYFSFGYLNDDIKTNPYHVRAVRSFTNEPNYLWSTGDTTSTITVTPSQTTEYTVTVTSQWGCTGTASKVITTLTPISTSTHYFLCDNASDTLTAREALSYQWSTGDTSRAITVSNAGFYLVTATLAGGECPVVDTFKVTNVKVNGISDISIPEMCAGNSTTVTSGTDAICNVTFVTHETILALHDTVFLPDGVECEPYGCSYQSPLTFAGYADTAHVNSVNDIRYLRINMEHSYAGDLYINLTCPNGQKADILRWGYQIYSSDCASQISNASFGWQSDEEGVYNSPMSTDFGLANKPSDSEFPCDPDRTKNAFGTGWDYCWSNNTNQGYTYADGNGSLIYRSCNSQNYGSFWNSLYIFDSSDVVAGTQFYHPDESFESLIGCPLNGSWYIEVMDGNNIDNGYIFGWELALAEDIQTIEYADVVHTVVEGPWVTAISDSSFLFSPPADLPHDTVVDYLFHCYSQFGCGYDTLVSISIIARKFVESDTLVCDSFVWNGVTYTADTTLSDTLTGIQGCDSIVTVHVHIITSPTVTISGAQYICADSSVILTASDAQSYLWSTGDTTQTITVNEPGIYTVTATFVGGCTAESAEFQLFESVSPIIDAHLSNMVAGDTQTVVIGTSVDANLQYANPPSTVTYSNITFLPDGVPCDTLGCSYTAEMVFTDFPDTAVIHSAEEIRYIRLNMEHSALIDLYINLTCPNGQQADILKKYDGNSSSECSGYIDNSHRGWPSGNVQSVYGSHYPHKMTWLGEPNTSNSNNNSSFPCDSSKNKPGVGWNYCWSNNTTEGYQYASANGSLMDTSNAILYYNNGVMALSNLKKIVIDSSNFAAGTQFYHPDVSFDSLVGCPINGTWTVEVIDGISSNNGYIFESELSFANYLLEDHVVSVIQMDFDSLWVTQINDSVFIITPPDTLANDTTVTYTFTLIDENGCVFDTTVTITIYAHKHTVLYDTICLGDTLDFNGQLLTQEGVYYDTIHTVIGYDSVVTLNLALKALLEVSITASVDTTCAGVPVTLQVSASDNLMAYLWSTGDTTASITVVQEENTDYSVTVTSTYQCTGTAYKTVAIGEIIPMSTSVYICESTPDTLTAREGDAFLWSTGDTTQSIVVSDVNLYTVTVSSASDCQVVDTFKVISVQISEIPHVEIPEMCAGGSYPIVVGNNVTSSQTSITHETILSIHDTVFLPDGVYCEPYGCYYSVPFAFTGYADTAHVNSAQDIRYVRINMEHSYSSDLYINLTCPNGQKADILRCGGTYIASLHSECSVNIPLNSFGWQLGMGNNTSADTRFGLPYQNNDIPDNYLCDRTYPENVPGVGWNYCWSQNDNYSYAGGDGSLIYRNENAHYAIPGNKSFDSSNVAVGSQFYHPDDSFDSLVGCPLNGVWHIEVMDGMDTENGYIFECELALPEDIQTVEFADEVQVEVEGPWVTATSDSTFVFSPPVTLSHDTTVNYSFHYHNQFGCSYDTVIEVNFYARYIDTLSLSACDSIVWNGVTYTADTTLMDTLTCIHGCDSIVTVNLHVTPTSPVTISGPQFFCADAEVTLTANVEIEPLSYLWSNGATTPTITVGDVGVYSVTAFYADGCTSESADFLLQEAQNPIIDAHLSDMVAGDTQYLDLTLQPDASIDLMLLQGPWAIIHPDTTFTVTPPDTLENDTLVTYTFTLIDTNGCSFDTVIHIAIYAHKHTDLYNTVYASELPYSWNGLTFTQAGCQDTLFLTTHGADSLVTMHLSVKYPYDTTVCENQIPLYWHGQTFISTASVTISHSLGCADSIEVISVSVHPVYHDTTEYTICANELPYLWHNQEISNSGTYYDSLTSSFHCDSIFMLVLTVADTSFIELYDTVLQNDLPYPLNDEVYDTTGVYVQHKENAAGCDSLITLHLTVLYNVRTELDSTVCDSLLPVIWNDITFQETRVDSVVLIAANGVDSTVVMHLTVNSSTSETQVVGIVENDLPYTINEVTYDSAGTYVQHLTNAVGCDSVLTIHLLVDTNSISYRTVMICQNMLPAVWEGHVWTEAGVVVDTFTAVSGADSIVVKTLNVGLPTTNEIYDTIVQNNLPYVLNDSIYYVPDDYVQHRINAAGCDSTITLHLTVFYNVRTELDSTVCDSLLPVVWNDITFTEAGVDSVTFQAANGADSVVVMTLTVKESSDSLLVISEIENNLPYIINGFEYDSTGVYVQHLDNAMGCDSTLTIALTVLYNVWTEVDSAVCDSLLPILWNNVEFTGAGTDSVTLTASTGVDSTVVMTLTVNYPTAATFADTVLENNLPSYQLNGFHYDTAGTYIQHLTNVNGCDSVLTLQLTVLYNVTSEVDSTVCPNELPFTWNGKVFTTVGTQTAMLTAANGVDSIVTMTLHLWPSPNAHITGPEVLCADNFAVLVADSATSYLWSTGDTTQTTNVYTIGVYSLTVTNEYGCIATDSLPLTESVTVNPIEYFQFPDLCAGNDFSITVGHQSTCTIVLENPVSTLSWADTVFLPDGVYCSPYGCSYQSPLTFTDFAPGSTVSSVNDILYVRLNMEHSYASDVYINLTCPNGQKADILKFKGHSSSTFDGPCMSEIPLTSRNWQNGNNASGSTFFGMAYDHSSQGNNACNPNTYDNAPGIGWNYCWSNNNDQGYTYAPGQGSLVYRAVNAHEHTNPYYTFWNGEAHYVDIFDSSNVAAGTQFYHPDQSFQSLIGCPLNGSWYIEVIDGTNEDNGYIFEWELALAPYLVPTSFSDVTLVTVDGPWVTTVSDTSFLFSPPDTLEHDTVVAYTFHLQDQYGCGYDTTVYLNVYMQSNTVFDTTVCGSFVWNGTTYTQSQEITWNGVNVHGCDSTVAINLTVYPIPTTTISGLPVPCVDDTAHLTAVCADTAALLVWSTGDTAQTITVTSSGDYGVTATNPKCSYDATVSVEFTSPTYSTVEDTVCDSLLWNGTLYTQTGVYMDTLTNSVGCDSVITLNLTVLYSSITYDTLLLMQNQLPYYFAPSDTTFPVGSPAEFQFSYTFPAQNGCDSVIIEKVYVFMNYSFAFDTTVCADALPLQWHGHTFAGAGTITDSLQTVHGSDSVLTYTVTVDAISATIGNVTHINCYGESTGAATATVTGGISPLAYQWTNSTGSMVSVTTQISNQPAGDYTFTVTDNVGCSATATVTLNTLHGQMSPGTISGPQTLCYGDTLGQVNGTAATGDECTYQWQISTDGNTWTPAAGTNNTQNYTLLTPATSDFQLRRAWIGGACGTLYSDTLAIAVWPVSSDTIYDELCEGQPYQQHGFDISGAETMGHDSLTFVEHYTSVNGCDSAVTLMLTIHKPQETNLNVEICEGDGYYGNGFAIPASETVGADSLMRVLNLQTTDGCDSIVRLEATIIDTALRIENLTPDFCEDMMAELVVETNMTDYVWSTGEQMPNITVTAPGMYMVTATQGECSVSARYVIEPCIFELYLPNAISSSREDGLNDYFSISEHAQGMINLFEISIFNRWGELVFYSNNKGFQWNGEVKGQIYHQNVYNYIIEYTDSAGRPYRMTGTITVL